MKNPIEVEIVKKYIIPSKQERIIWEFSNPKKRSEIVFQRLHDYKILKSDCLKPIKYLSPSELEKCLFELSKAQEVYYIGLNYIGPRSLRDAVEATDSGDICIIYCGNGIGYYQGEQYYGGAMRFILVEKEQLE